MIHPSAIIHPKAQLAEAIEIAPYVLIGEHVCIDVGCTIGPHTVIDGHTQIGANNRFHGSCFIGCTPQDKKYQGEASRLQIGDNNDFFQFITVAIGTDGGGGVTTIGDNNWLMAYVHVAHDCQIGSHTIFANNVTLAGHVHIGDWAVLGGFTTVHQFCRIGCHALTAFTAAVAQDVLPYIIAAGNRAVPRGINVEGLQRRGFDTETIRMLKEAYKMLYRQGLSLAQAQATLQQWVVDCPALQAWLDFIPSASRGLIR